MALLSMSSVLLAISIPTRPKGMSGFMVASLSAASADEASALVAMAPCEMGFPSRVTVTSKATFLSLGCSSSFPDGLKDSFWEQDRITGNKRSGRMNPVREPWCIAIALVFCKNNAYNSRIKDFLCNFGV